MRSKTKRRAERIVAAVLACLLVLQLMPMNTFAGLKEDERQTEAATDETVTVKGTVNSVQATEEALGEQAGEPSTEATGNVTGIAIAGAQVTITDVNGTVVATATTDDEGAYAITGLTKGEVYYISVESTGYHVVSNLLISFDNEDESGNYVNDIVMQSAAIESMYFAFRERVIYYTENADDQLIFSVMDPTAARVITYSSEDENIAIADEATGRITPVGVGTVTITATDENGETAAYELTINKASQAALTWLYSIPVGLTWKDSFTNTVTGGTGNGLISYDITAEKNLSDSDDDIADIDTDTGALTFKKPGTITVTATKAAGTNLAGNEVYEPADVSYTLTVNRVSVDDFVFETETPSAITYGTTDFVNQASSAAILADNKTAATGAIMYDIVSQQTLEGEETTGVALVEQDTGAITPLKSGIITVKATRAEDDYYELAERTYILTIERSSQDNFSFSLGNSCQMTLGEKFINTAQNADSSSIEYAVSAEYTLDNQPATDVARVDKHTGAVTALKAGIVTITATSLSDDRYSDKTIEYTLVINKAGQSVVFEKGHENIPSIDYGTQSTYTNKATANTDITYTSSDETVATVDSKNGTVTIIKPGTVTIKAEAAESDYYSKAVQTYELTINKVYQTISFDKGTTPAIKFNDNNNIFINEAIGENGAKADSYSIIYGEEFLIGDIDNETGKFTVGGAGGTIQVEATYEETEYYYKTTAAYTLTVGKADQKIAFPKGEYEITAGSSFEAVTAQVTGANSGLDIQYTLKTGSDTNGIIASVNALTGELIFVQPPRAGSATIIATKPADENYNEAVAEYRITVKEWEPDTSMVTVRDKDSHEGGWYRENVSIYANDGYLISSTGSKDSWGTQLLDVVVEDTAANGKDITIYVKNIAQGFVGKLTINVLKDSKPPTASISIEGDSVWDKLLTILTFGLWNKTTADMTIACEDTLSGVASVQYVIIEGSTGVKTEEELKAIAAENWKSYDDKAVTIDKADVYVVYAKVTDNAGNYVYATTNGIVSDKAEPAVDMEILTEQEGGFYTGDVKIKVTASDSAPYSGLSKVEYEVMCNHSITQTGTLYDFEAYAAENGIDNPEYEDLVEYWESSDDSNIVVDSSLNNEDNVTITVKATDNAGHTATDTETINIYVADKTAEIIDVRFSEEPAVAATHDGVNVYTSDRKAEITITGRKSSFREPEVTVTAVDNDGNNIAYAYTITDWQISGDDCGNKATMKATVTFSSSAIYELKVAYEDKSQQQKEQYSSGTFIIDKQGPAASVSIDSNTWSTLLEVLTFGIYKDTSMTVSAFAYDDVTAVAKIEYLVSLDTSIMTEEALDAATGWREYTGPFSIDENKVFTVYIKATDIAGRTSYISSQGHIIDMEDSAIVIEPEEGNDYGFHKENVDVDITVQEKTHLSGIRQIIYWVEVDGKVPEGEMELFNFDDMMKGAEPTYDDLVFIKSYTIKVDKERHNGDEVYVYVKTIDNAGNEWVEKSERISINSTVPSISVSYDNNEGNIVDGLGYFKENRVAKITIGDRNSTFNPDGVIITATAVNGKGDEITLDLSAMMGEWKSDKGLHTLELKFSGEGEYTYSVSYTNKADMEASAPVVNDSVSPFHFVIDSTAPTASMNEGENTWENLLETLTFGLYSSGRVTLSASSEDEYTDECTVQYYIANASEAPLTISQLDKITRWSTYAGDITIDEDMKFSVYLKVTDNAGNVTYINTDGYIVDTAAPVVQLIPDKTDKQHNGVGLYTGDVNVKIKVTDQEPYSGIDKVEYWVKADGVETQREVLFDYVGELGQQSDMQHEFTHTIVVESAKNNTCDVKVYVMVKDMLGNVYTTTADEALKLDIDATAPKVVLTYDNNEPYQTISGAGYYDKARRAKVQITERTAHINLDLVKDSFVITGKKANGENVIGDYRTLFEDWSTTEDKAGDVNKAIHTFTIDFAEDANYTMSVACRDIAGWKCEIDNMASATPYIFTVDTCEPEGKVSVGKLGTWDRLLSTLTFGLWTKDTVDVTVTSSDETSAVSVYYYKTNSDKAMTATELDKLTTWKAYNKLSVDSDEQFVVYFKLVDRAGNTRYLSSNGVVVDKTRPAVEAVEPAITVTPQQPVNGIYNGNVKVAVSVTDTIKNGTYSGIKEIRYEVLNLGKVTQEGVLLSAGTERIRDFSKSDAIIVDKRLNNSNDVVVRVYAKDNVGNEASRSASIKIDITAPSIDVSYDNNAGETAFAGSTYFNTSRVATITITERNFNPDNVVITATNTDNVKPALSGWTERRSSTGNGDTTTYTATLTYSADGDYTFDISCTDEAGNKSTAADYGTSLAPTEFTIDKTAPVIQVAYDNNEAHNGNYYASQRVATITVTEHNFEQSRIALALTATDDGETSTLPVVGEWRSNGDVHILTITYADDSLYTFDFDYTDKAGNAMADIAQQSFYIDKTVPLLTISDITDNSANNADGDIGFVITATDVNFDVFEPVLTAFIRNQNGEIETVNYTLSDVGTVSDVDNGKRFTVANLEADGIYKITCTLVDKAGNAYTEVLLENENGSAYTEQRAGQDTLLSFSVNRYGSSYGLDEATAALVENYYVQNVDNDITIMEVNADPLSEYRITLNGEELIKDSEYTVSKEHKDGKWYSYTYLIDKSYFENDGEYTIVVASKDKAANDSYSDVKDTSVTFVVDRTAPVVSVTGLATDANYQTDSQTVTLVPTDDGGALRSVVVSLVDDDGNEIKKLLNLAEAELEKALEEGEGRLTFQLGEGLNQNVRIECADCSVDAYGNTNVFTQTITGVSVSTSQMMIWWSNKPLRYGIIGGVAVIGIGAAALVLRKRTKKKVY